MSYPMSPPAQKPPPRPYSPYQNAGSPINPPPYGPPPAKRQRMSPDPRSPPNGASHYAYPGHSPQVVSSYGNPYGPPTTAHSPYGTPGGYSASPQSAFNTPQPYPYQQMPWQSQPGTPASAGPQHAPPQSSPPQQQQSREMMPPPPRPEREERAGVDDLGDSLYGNFINLKEEENYHYNHASQGESFSTAQNTSFGSTTMSPGNSFNMLTQGTSFGSQDAQAAFAGTMGSAMTEDEVEMEQRRKRERAATALAESRQQHLNNQFLLCNNVRKRMDRIGRENGVSINMVGVFVRGPDTRAAVNGDTKQGIVAADDKVTDVKADTRPESVVNQGSTFEPIVALMSLAAGERLRGLLDESYSLARARRYGDHGRVVPTQFADIAEGPGKRTDATVASDSVTGTQWDKTGENGSATPQPTVSFSGTLNGHLRDLAERDRVAEQARLKKREARKRAAEAATNGEAAAPASEDTAMIGAPAETAAPLKITKKEAAKQAKEKNSSTEAQLHNTTNQTAAMMTLGKKGKKYSWMTGGVSSMPTNRFAKPAGNSGTATPTNGPDDDAPTTSTTLGGTAMAKASSGMGKDAAMRDWGEWSEDSLKGIEMRDWLLVLERDGREKAALEKAMMALK